MARSCVIIGSGRAGGSFHDALAQVGWTSRLIAARPLLNRYSDAANPSESGRRAAVGEDSADAHAVPVGTDAPGADVVGADAVGAVPVGTDAAVADVVGAVPVGTDAAGADVVDADSEGLGASDLAGALSASDLDLVLIAVPDAAIVDVARVLPSTDAVVAHVSGACALDVLAPHGRVGSIHPLMSLPDASTGSRRLLDACTFAVDGDPLMREVVDELGGRAIDVPASSRAMYHATAAIAANHLTALCAQVESLAERVGVPVDAYWTMMRTTLDNVADTGAAVALTGPAARGDWNTIRAHLAALPTDHDVDLYRSLCEAAARLAGHELPAWWDES